MPKDTVDRAIKKAAGSTASEDYVEVRYEGYGPSGVAVIVEALTDNRNRTASDIRSAFNKHSGDARRDQYAVSFMFERHLGHPLSGRRRRCGYRAGGRDRGGRRECGEHRRMA